MAISSHFVGRMGSVTLLILLDPNSGLVHHDFCSIRGDLEGLPWEVEVLLWVDEVGASFGISVRLG